MWQLHLLNVDDDFVFFCEFTTNAELFAYIDSMGIQKYMVQFVGR